MLDNGYQASGLNDPPPLYILLCMWVARRKTDIYMWIRYVIVNGKLVVTGVEMIWLTNDQV